MKHSLTRKQNCPTRNIHWLLVLMISALTSNVHAQGYSFGDYAKARTMPTLASVGLITVTSALASQNPKATGIGLIALSPMAGIRSYARRGASSGIVSMVGIAGLGWYNFDELAKDKYSKTRVFEKNMIIMGSALTIGLLLDGARYAMSSELQSQFGITPTNEGLTFNYSYRF